MFIFVINKNSGKGKTLKVWDEVELYLQSKKVDYQVLVTESKEDVLQLKSLINNVHTKISGVIAIGGDGTSQEVINQLVDTGYPFSVIPTGSGNDFARARGLDRNVRREVDRIIGGRQEKIDLMKVDSKYCLTVIGLGFDGVVAQVTNQMGFKKWLGSFSYIISVLKVLRTYKPSSVELTIDGEYLQYDKVWLIAIANYPYYGGGMKICPNATSQDGLVDICIVHGQSRWKLLLLFPSVFKGEHVKQKGVNILQGREIIVNADKQLIIHGDGEIIGVTPITITIEKNALNIIS
ncbi:diacylglycerol kinase family protein [Alkalihalophilus sp. As8PL]|uniref:Diacylglycerol kinase family protein n=1 Tax=Alkalihalophilus sp. As8PL TaxID=3237103 RepID=A0AB39BSK0_9BACI